MVLVRHIDGETVDVENPHFLLTNRNGDFLSLGMPNRSDYNGLYVRDTQGYMKVLWDITPASPIREISLNGNSAERVGDDRQRLALLDQGMLMDLDGSFTLTLDCKRMHDHPPERNYDITDDGIIRITCGTDSYIVHVCIATGLIHELVDEWRPVRYEYDERRNTPSDTWVYDALVFQGKGKLALVAGDDMRACETDARELLEQDFPEPETDSIGNALDTLTGQHIVAGLPWFHQEWSRDAFVALGGLMQDHDLVLRTLDRWYDAVTPDGTIHAIYPDEGLPSADAPGWLARRTLQMLENAHPGEERSERWAERLERIINTQKRKMREGLIFTGKNETWMDTQGADDGREGARIEIQACFLALCAAHRALTGRDEHDAGLVRSAVRERLVHDGLLLDGLHADGSPDMTVRPNVFLAHQLWPDLFSNDEWAGFFRRTLDSLWLRWGGLSSIAPDHDLFMPYDTGEDTAAYHRGDSWYFVNNLAALSLHRIGGFSYYVGRIRDASLRDLREQGFCGHCSEISSAARQEAMGCHAQAWSASTLRELMNETHNTL